MLPKAPFTYKGLIQVRPVFFIKIGDKKKTNLNTVTFWTVILSVMVSEVGRCYSKVGPTWNIPISLLGTVLRNLAAIA
jgi:hypothetical protein